ncbi:hypothetical protein MTO96_020825 [Rhipicephalus appendiculatus]
MQRLDFFFGRRLSCQPHLLSLLLVMGTPAFSPAEAKWVKRRRMKREDAGATLATPAGAGCEIVAGRPACLRVAGSAASSNVGRGHRRQRAARGVASLARPGGARFSIPNASELAEVEEEARMGMAQQAAICFLLHGGETGRPAKRRVCQRRSRLLRAARALRC